MTTHETVNRLYAEIRTLLRKDLGAAGDGVFAMLKSVEGKLTSKLVWELRLIGNIRNQVVHECLEPVPRYFEALCSEAIEALRTVQAAHKSKTNNSPKAKGVKQTPSQAKPVQQVSKLQVPSVTNPQASNQQSQKQQMPNGQSRGQKVPQPPNSNHQKSKQQNPKQPTPNPQASQAIR